MAVDAAEILTPTIVNGLPTGWSWKRLDSVCEGVFDCPHSTPLLTQDGPFIARSQDMRSGVFRTDEAGHVSDETYRERVVRAEPKYGDLLYSREGTYFGIAAEVPRGIQVCLGQRMVLLRPHTNGVNFRFLRYWLNSPVMSMYAHGFRDGTVAERLNLPTIRALPVAIPSLPEQRAIAHILGTLDDKIELNRRMNETLEAMAQALFKSWFVGFDPIRAKAEGRDPGLPKCIADLFPNRIVDSELGEIPAGWRIASLEHLCRRVAMGPFGSDIKTDNFVEAGVPVIRGGNLTNGFVDEGFVFVPEKKADELRNANAFSDDIVITHRGTLGQVGLIPRKSRFPRYVVSQSQMVLSANPSVATPRFLFEYLCSPEGQNQLLANTSQTGVPAIARPTTSLKSIRLVCPPFDILQSFETLISPLSDRAIANQLECRTLTGLRDTLLPKLLSGQVRVGKFDFTPDPSKNVSNA